jgi:hypothetical protein
VNYRPYNFKGARRALESGEVLTLKYSRPLGKARVEEIVTHFSESFPLRIIRGEGWVQFSKESP